MGFMDHGFYSKLSNKRKVYPIWRYIWLDMATYGYLPPDQLLVLYIYITVDMLMLHTTYNQVVQPPKIGSPLHEIGNSTFVGPS